MSIRPGATLSRPARVARATPRPLVVSLTLSIAVSAICFAPRAHAQATPDAQDEAAVPKNLGDLVLDTGRAEVKKGEDDLVRLQVHGEYQVRYHQMRAFPLDVAPRVLETQPDAISDTLGQTKFLHHWLRFTPRLQIRESVEIIGQMDLVTGVVLGDLAHDTSADHTPRDAHDGFGNVRPRWLYLQAMTKYGLLRIGQQPNHLGIGILANDGDHPPLFGDYRYGSIAERVLFATRPGGKEHPIVVALAADLIFQDARTRLVRGDIALQGVAAAYYERGPNQIGVFGVLRHQSRDKTSTSDLFEYTDRLRVLALAVTGRFAARVPSSDAFVFGAGEIAGLFGSTNLLRTQSQALTGAETTIRSYGGAVQLGVVHRAYGAAGDAEKDPKPFGDVVGQIEVGYASGDADPYDGVERRFVMDPNHKVGLLLFDELLRFQTARASTAAQDPLLQNATRPTPGVDLLPSQGGIYGAQYINPTAIVRPKRWLDLKGGMVLAQSTADVVSPYRVATRGAYTNYRGGDARHHDLGVEVDVGVEARAPLDYGLTLQLGAQAGVLFPGRAFADETGETIRPPWLVVGRFGLQF